MKIIKKKYFFLFVLASGLFGAYFLLSNHFNQLKFEKVLKNKKNLQDLILASQKLKKHGKKEDQMTFHIKSFLNVKKV